MRASALCCGRLGAPFELSGASVGYAQLGSYLAEYAVVGRGEPCVVVPGLAGGYQLARPIVEALAENFQVITYQLRGEGDAFGLRAKLGLSDLARDLRELLEYLGIERPAVLGLSFGSAVALEFAWRYSHRLTALAVQGADTRLRAKLVGEFGWRLLRRIPFPHDGPLINRFFDVLLGPGTQPPELRAFVVGCCWRTDQTVMAQRLGMLMDFDVTDQLWRVDVPTLVVGSARDPFASEAGQRRLEQGIADARRVVLPGAGHLGFLTHRDLFCRYCKRFLHEVLSPSA